MKNIKILVRFDCPDCAARGMFPREDRKDILEKYHMSVTKRTYSHVYCPTCRGQKWLEEWVPVKDVLFKKGD
jgi:hypothetical protein